MSRESIRRVFRGSWLVVAFLAFAGPSLAQFQLCDAEIKSIRVRATDDAVIARVADLANDATPDWNGEKVMRICSLSSQDGNVSPSTCKVYVGLLVAAQSTGRVVVFNVDITTPGS